MVELYMDKLIDLMPVESNAKPPKLEIREEPQTGLISILNVATHPVDNLAQAYGIYKTGTLSRKTASTAMNEDSSRSHLVFAVIVRTVNNQTGQRSSAKLSFCDLAGSEKVSKANPTICQLNEGKAINQSLSALREVIRTLSTSGQNGSDDFIPYRRNKLT